MVVDSHAAVERFHQCFSYQGSYLTHLLYFLLKLDVDSQCL